MLNQLGGKEPTSTLFEVFYSDKYTSTNYSVVVNFVSKHGVKLWYEDEAIGQLSRQRMTPVFLFDGKNTMPNNSSSTCIIRIQWQKGLRKKKQWEQVKGSWPKKGGLNWDFFEFLTSP